MMAVGRSSRALGVSAPRLWASERDPQRRRQRYVWDAAARVAVIRLVEG
jgi:YD repeat-containing protein